MSRVEQTTHVFDQPEWFAWGSSLVVFSTCCIAFVIQSQARLTQMRHFLHVVRIFIVMCLRVLSTRYTIASHAQQPGIPSAYRVDYPNFFISSGAQHMPFGLVVASSVAPRAVSVKGRKSSDSQRAQKRPRSSAALARVALVALAPAAIDFPPAELMGTLLLSIGVSSPPAPLFASSLPWWLTAHALRHGQPAQALLLAYSMLVRYLEVKRSLRQHHTGGSEPEQLRNKWSALAGSLSVVRTRLIRPSRPSSGRPLLAGTSASPMSTVTSLCSDRLPNPRPQCGAMGVCAVPLHTGWVTHTFFAMLFFISGGVYQYTQNWIDRETGMAREVPSWVESMRKYTSWGAVGIMSVFVPGFFIGRIVTGHVVAYPPIVATCAIFEIVTMVLLLLNLSTYGISVRGLSLNVTLAKARNLASSPPA